jgi:hypothetical protein
MPLTWLLKHESFSWTSAAVATFEALKATLT